MAKNKKKLCLKLFKITNLYDIKVSDVYKYIKNLHEHIRKQNKRIKTLRLKLKHLRANKRTTNKKETEEIIEINEEAETQNDDLEIKKFLDDIKKTAQDVDLKNRYIYEPTSGLYYDPETGYYYNAEYGLFYDGESGTYYRYNDQTHEYEFHSQVELPQENDVKEISKKAKLRKRSNHHRDDRSRSISRSHSQSRRRRRSRSRLRSRTRSRSRTKSRRSHKDKSKKSKKKRKSRDKDEPKEKVKKEEGELSSTSEENSRNSVILIKSDGENDKSIVIEEATDEEVIFCSEVQDIAKKYPPSLRLVIQETTIPTLRNGMLFLVTCKGGTLGREGNHDVIIPDINVSKFHLKFIYDEKKSIYQFIDLGSRNGTIFNGNRVTSAKQESKPVDLPHGSTIQIGVTKLLCHIHNGNYTCGQCEPGLLLEAVPNVDSSEKIVAISHKEGLKMLQKKFGLENEKYIQPKNPDDYTDRSAQRRKIKGSSNEHEKTECASVHLSIPNNNKGFKLLSKLGWKEGESLGKSDSGILEPIGVDSYTERKGLGAKTSLITQSSFSGSVLGNSKKKAIIWKKAQERYEKCDIFISSDSDD